MKAKRFLSILASFMILVTAVPASSMAANVPSGSAKTSVGVKMYSVKSTVRAVSGVYTVHTMPYRYNATTAAAITIRGNRNQNSSYKMARGTRICVVNILNYKGVILYETVSKSGGKYIHGYIPAKTGSIVFKYQYGYTSINRQPVYSLSGKRTASYLNARQKATMLYMVGKKCAILFDTKSGKNTGFGVVNFRGKAI